MAKQVIKFVCRSCGAMQPRWMGKCPDCGEWDSLEEYREAKGQGASQDAQRGSAQPVTATEAPQAHSINKIDESESATSGPRLSTGIAELDRVLGGSLEYSAENISGKKNNEKESAETPGFQGFVPGSAVLIGGDPGVGKSTLMLQAAHQLAVRGHRVLYVSSEESAHQLRLRARRLGAVSDKGDELYVLADTNLARIVEQTRRIDPEVLVIDSVQMIY